MILYAFTVYLLYVYCILYCVSAVCQLHSQLCTHSPPKVIYTTTITGQVHM